MSWAILLKHNSSEEIEEIEETFQDKIYGTSKYESRVAQNLVFQEIPLINVLSF